MRCCIHPPNCSSHAFGLADAVVVLAACAIVIALLSPSLAQNRTVARMMQNNTQTRGIHQGLFIFAQGNKRGGGDGYFPGLNSRGLIAEAPPAQEDGQHFGAVPGTASNDVAWLLTGDFIPAGSAEYFINPMHVVAEKAQPGETIRAPLDPDGPANFSYAFLDYAGLDEDGNPPPPGAEPLAPGRATEWRETINTQAAVISDRNTGANTEVGSRISSYWTEPNSGRWHGAVTRNDSSTSFEETPVLDDLKYGVVDPAEDHLFENDPVDDGRDPTANALLISGPRDVIGR